MNLYFDIGANIGDYTEELLNTIECSVVSIEANYQTFKKLESRFFGKTNVKTLNYAVSSNVGEVDFYEAVNCDVISTCDKDWITKSRFNQGYNWKKVKVNTISIDELISTFGVPYNIKIDVEGYELNVLRSINKNYGCRIQFEWTEEKLTEIIDSISHLADLGYKRFGYIYFDKFNDYPSLFYGKSDFIRQLQEICKPDRKELWGMIFCEN